MSGICATKIGTKTRGYWTVFHMKILLVADPASPHTQKWVRGWTALGATVTVPPASLRPRRGREGYSDYLRGGPALQPLIAQADIVVAIGASPYGVWADRGCCADEAQRKRAAPPLVLFAAGSDIYLHHPHPPADLLRVHRALWYTRGGWLGRLEFRIRQYRYRAHVASALTRAQLIIASSHALAGAVSAWFDVEASRVCVNRWGLDTAPYDQALSESPAPEDRPIHLLSPRGLRAVYHGEAVTKALVTVLEDHPNAQATVLTGGLPVPQSAPKHARLRYEPRFLTVDEMAQRWASATHLVSVPPYEAVSSVLYEAAYSGVVPIVYPNDATLEVFGSGASEPPPLTRSSDRTRHTPLAGEGDDHTRAVFVKPPLKPNRLPAAISTAIETALSLPPNVTAHIRTQNRAWADAECRFEDNALVLFGRLKDLLRMP
jgi:hypothetical protein